MEKVVGADKGAEVPVIEPNKSGEVPAAKKEDFYRRRSRPQRRKPAESAVWDDLS